MLDHKVLVYRVSRAGEQPVELRLNDRLQDDAVKTELEFRGYQFELIAYGDQLPDTRSTEEIMQALELLNLVW